MAIVANDRRPVVKTELLLTLDRIGNESTNEQLRQIQQVLRSTPSLIELFHQVAPKNHAVEQQELEHVAKDWFHIQQGWWIESFPEDLMRAGIDKSIDIAVEHGHGDRPLPVDYWWVKNADAFRFESLVSPQQQTILVMTPPVPTRRPKRGASQAGKTAAKQTAKPAASKTVKPASKQRGKAAGKSVTRAASKRASAQPAKQRNKQRAR